MSMPADVAPQNLAMIVISLNHRLVRSTSPSAALQLLEIVTAFFSFEIARLPVKLTQRSAICTTVDQASTRVTGLFVLSKLLTSE
jgi:hypothetical protein